MTYAEAIAFLNSLARFGWRLGLDRMEALCERLGHPERTFASVQLTGTNGKGSTATFLAGILQAAGLRTGLYTSPHVYTGRERIQIDGAMITEGEVAEIVQALLPHIEAVNKQRGPVTEFEAWTMVMFVHFHRQGVQTAVIEAGLGGRWDSTNVVPSRLGIITNVSLDHTDRLGSTIREIARDKAGIIKPGGKVLIGQLTPEAADEVVLEAAAASAKVFVLRSHDALWTLPAYGTEQFEWESEGDSGIALTLPDGARTSTLYQGASYQARNAALAAAAAEILIQDGYLISSGAVKTGLACQAPGRFEVIRTCPEVILDGAHNPAAAAVLAAELARGRTTPYPDGIPEGETPDLRLVFGGSSGHDVEGCLKILAPLAVEVILTRARNPRSRDPKELARFLEGLEADCIVIPDVPAALGMAIERSRPFDRICVTGSFFVLGEIPRPLPPMS